MLHQLIATICGITLHTQVNACRITLQQATIDYNNQLNVKAEKLKQHIEPHVRNEYTDKIFLIGKIAYDKQISVTKGSTSLLLKQDRVLCTIRWTF